MSTKRIILISGVARSGKDTLANAIAKEMHDTHHIQGQVFKFANPLKGSIQTSLQAVGLGYVDAWTEDTDLKVALRPLLVEFGKYCRSINRDVFVNKTLSDIEDAQRLSPMTHIVPIISDLRYLNEIQRVHSWAKHQKVSTNVFWAHINRMGQGPANDEERRSLDELSKAGLPDNHRTFAEGDVDGITDWAKEIVTKICKPSLVVESHVPGVTIEKLPYRFTADPKHVTATVPEHLTGTIKVPSNELLEQVLNIKLTLERMDARLKRLEIKDQPNF